MEDIWQVQEAKARFGEVIDRALTEGPQTVTRHGKPVVQVVAIDDRKAAPKNDGFVEFLLRMPKAGPNGLELPRRTRKGPPGLGE